MHENHKDIVMIRTYNSEATLGPTVERVFSLMPEAHVVIADDGSEDTTRNIMDTLDRIHPGQVHNFFYPHRGVSATLKSILFRTTGLIKNSSAKTIACYSCDSDDFLESGVLDAAQRIQKGADLCFLPFQHQPGYVHKYTQPSFYNWVPEYLSGHLQYFADLSKSKQNKVMEHMAMGYPFKVFSGNLLTKYTEGVVSYFPDNANIGEDIPSVLCPLYKDALITGTTLQGYTYIKRVGSATDTSTYAKREKEIRDKTLFAQLPSKVLHARPGLFSAVAPKALAKYQERHRTVIETRMSDDPRLLAYAKETWNQGLRSQLSVVASQKRKKVSTMSYQPGMELTRLTLGYGN